MNSAPIWKLLEAQGNLRQLPNGSYSVSCRGPVHKHGDRNPSLTVAVADDGKVLLHCKAGDSTEDVLDALGATWRDLWPDGSPPGEKRFEARDRNGKSHGSHQRYYDSSGKKQGGWVGNDGGATKMPLYGAEKLKDLPSGGHIFLTEGEPPCEALWKRNVAAVGTMTGAGAIPCDKSLLDLRKYTVILWPDNDDVGRRHMEKIAERLKALKIEHLWLEYPDAPPKGDAVEYFAFGGTVEELKALIRDAQSEKAPPLLGVLMSDVEVEDIRWLWHRRVALGKLAMFDGDGGVGKSLVTLDLAARVAMGHPMPDGSPGPGKGAGVVMICGEDGLADTVKPRLLAAGVSPEALRRIRVINGVPEPLEDGTTSERLISLLADRGAIETALTEMGAKVLIVDPLTAYLGDQVDAYKDSEIRRVLTPLALMAERTGCAIVAIRHLNRSNGASAQHRGLGSVGILNVARLGLLFAPNPDTEGEYLMSRYKGNIGAPPPTMGYRITQVGEAENMPKVEWLGERETSAEAGLAAVSGAGADRETRTATDEAIEWLRSLLSDGPRATAAVNDAARTDGIKPKPLWNARERLGVEAYREGGIASGGHWMLRLPFPDGGNLSKNGANEHAANPEFNGAASKIPSDENEGNLSTNPESNGDNATSESPISPKIPSRGEPIGAGHLSTGNVSADALEPTCSYCGRHKFWDLGSGLECEMCGEPLLETAPTPTPPAPQRTRWSSRQEVAAYD